MIRLLIVLTLLFLAPGSSASAGEIEATMIKRPFCSCCDGHADHLRANGFKITVIQNDQMSLVKKEHRVPLEFEGCHTILVDGYVVEGHVPAPVIKRLLAERPDIRGISLPGMPNGSPGMGGVKKAPFEIYEISDGAPKIYEKH